MINWLAVKQASFTGGTIKWNPWLGKFSSHPSDDDIKALAALPPDKYEDSRNALADQDQWSIADAYLRRSIGLGGWKYVPIPMVAAPLAAQAAANKSLKPEANEDPRFLEARKAMHENGELVQSDVNSYRNKIDRLVEKLRKQASKTAFDPTPVRKRNKNWLDLIRMKKHEVEICGINGETFKRF